MRACKLPWHSFRCSICNCNACKDDNTPEMLCPSARVRALKGMSFYCENESRFRPSSRFPPPLSPLPSSHGWRAHKALERTRTSLRLGRPSGAAAAPCAVADGRPKLAGLGEACGRRAYARLRPPVRPRAASDGRGRMAARLHLSPPRGTAGNARPFRFWTIARNVLRRVNKKLLSDHRERGEARRARKIA